MKRIEKLVSVLLCCLTAVSLCACGRRPANPDKQEKSGMTNIRIMNFDGGVGEQWLQAAKSRFEEKYKTLSLEDGKEGINIIIESKSHNGTQVLEYIKNSDYNVFFTEMVDLNQYIAKDVLLDISDILTEDLTAYGESVSVEDKMAPTMKSFLNVGTEETPKYYAAPFYEAYSGIMYDVDLFEEKGYYFKSDGTFVNPNSFDEGHEYVGNGTLSLGPDGKTGVIDGFDYSEDDGLPATYDQFFQLCDKMLGSGVTPLVWPGANQDYINELMFNLWSDYEGVDRMALNFTFDGVDDSIVESIGSDGTVTFKKDADKQAGLTITSQNGYETYNQAGKYYALKFVERIMRGNTTLNKKYAVSDYMSSSLTHLKCGMDFLKGNLSSSFETIGMMINGTWWENENTDNFNSVVSSFGDSASKQSRRIGFMPYPKATQEKVGEAVSPYCMKSSFCFINGNIKSDAVKTASKMFLQYVMTDESLKKFQQIASMPWALNYEMTQDDFNECTYYSRSVYKIHNNRSVVYPYSKNNIYKNNISKFFSNTEFIMSEMSDGRVYSLPTNAYFGNADLTAETYFEGIRRYRSQTRWQQEFGQYI